MYTARAEKIAPDARRGQLRNVDVQKYGGMTKRTP